MFYRKVESNLLDIRNQSPREAYQTRTLEAAMKMEFNLVYNKDNF